MADHTPTPWKIRDDLGFHIQGSPAEGEKYGESVTNVGGLAKPRTTGRSNAAFIVKAVNSHDALVKALRDAVTFYDGLDRSLDEGEARILDAMSAALKASEADHG